MAITPQNNTLLQKYTLVAKKIIFNTERMKQFLQMLGSKQGALQAIQTVMGAIEQHKPIPPAIAPLLGVNVYMIMVDLAQEITRHKPDPAILKEVIGTILGQVQQSHRQPQAQQAAPQPVPQQTQPAQGIIQRQIQGAQA